MFDGIAENRVDVFTKMLFSTISLQFLFNDLISKISSFNVLFYYALHTVMLFGQLVFSTYALFEIFITVKVVWPSGYSTRF